MREYLRSFLLMIYIFLARRGWCPCMIAGKVNHIIYVVGMFFSKIAAYIGGRLCHFLDGLVRESDNVCGPDCQGCRPQPLVGQSDEATADAVELEVA